MKKRTIMIVAALCAVSAALGASASSVIQKIEAELRPDFTVVIDGEERTFRDVNGTEVYPVLYEGTTYLPVRAIGEIMGKTVYWYEDDKRIELKDDSTTVTDADVIIPSGSSPTASPSATAAPAGEISLEEAKAISLEKAGVKESDVTFTKTKLETDHGIREYDIEFRSDTAKYSVEIKASDGTVTSWDIDNKISQSNDNSGADIGAAKAREAALAKAGFSEAEVTGLRSEVDFENGRKIYEIEFYKDRVEYSAEVLASDGSIISWDVDKD